MTTNLTPQEGAVLMHWSTYGQSGDPPMRRVIPSDWKTSPFQRPITSPWNVDIKPSDLSTLLKGFLPREMEDKWFIYAHGPDSCGRACLHFFRSWTGIKIAEVVLQTGEVDGEDTKGESAQITNIVWESDEDIVRLQDERGIKQMVREICRWVLKVELPADRSDAGVS